MIINVTYSSCIFINDQMIQFGVKCICMRDSSSDCCITSYCCIVTIITNASTVTAYVAIVVIFAIDSWCQ